MGRRPADPSIAVPLEGGAISITAAGPAALIRAFTAGRDQVVLRATLPQLAELIDALIARRSAMAKKHEPAPAIPARVAAAPVRRSEPDVEDEPIALPPVRQPRPIAQRPTFLTSPSRPVVPPVAPDVAPPSAPPPRTFKKLSPESIEKIRELHGKGWSDAAIGESLGVSSVAVCKRRNAMGLAPNYRGPARMEEHLHAG